MTTLRDIQTKAFPDTTGTSFIDHGDDASPRYTENPNFTAMRLLFTDAAAFTGRLIATSMNYISDSTLDSHYAAPAFLTDMMNVIYGYDQTMGDDEALTKWLDDEDCLTNFMMIAFYNADLTEDSPYPRPALFDHFDFERDDIDY